MPTPSWPGAVEVGVEGEASFRARLQVAPGKRMDAARAVRDMYRSAAPAPFVSAGLVVLDRLERRQQVCEAPAWISGLAPVVEVLAGGRESRPSH